MAQRRAITDEIFARNLPILEELLSRNLSPQAAAVRLATTDLNKTLDGGIESTWVLVMHLARLRPEHQDKLMALIVAIHQLPEDKSSDELIDPKVKAKWADLYVLDREFLYEWTGITLNPYFSDPRTRREIAAEFIHMNAFTARLMTLSPPIMDHKITAIWTLRDALETPLSPGASSGHHEDDEHGRGNGSDESDGSDESGGSDGRNESDEGDEGDAIDETLEFDEGDGIVVIDEIVEFDEGDAIDETLEFDEAAMYLAAGVEWIRVAGRVVYGWDEVFPHERPHGDAGRGGPLWDGVHGFCRERWGLWKRRFGELGAEERFDPELREKARWAKWRMGEIEGEVMREDGAPR